jgi:hypothetical protein
MKKSEIKKILSVKGFARPIDYIIRINVPFYHNIDPLKDPDGFMKNNSEHISTLNHELVHFFQFMGTSVGYRISQLDRFISAWQVELLKYLPEEVSIPISKWVEQNESLLKDPKIYFILSKLAEYENEYNFLCRHWKTNKPFSNSKYKNIDIEYFFKKKPIKLDVINSCFEITSPSGDLFKGDISGFQIMESMARLVQIWTDSDFNADFIIKECTNMFQLQYNFPMLYLLQEGIITSPSWEELPYTFLMCISHISLMMDPITLELYGDDKYKKLINRLNPGKIFLECLANDDIFRLFRNTFYSNMFLDASETQYNLEKLKNAFETQYNFKLGNVKKNQLEIYDSICEILDVPPYSYMLKLAIEELIEDQKTAIDVNYNETKNTRMREYMESIGLPAKTKLPLAEHRKLQFDIGINIMKKLQKNPDYLIKPLSVFDPVYVPFPPIIRSDYSISMPPGHEKTWEKNVSSEAIAGYGIIRKIFYDANLACYRSFDGSDMIVPCQFFEECREIKKNNLLEFCKNEYWRGFVKTVLESLRIKKICILE